MRAPSAPASSSRPNKEWIKLRLIPLALLAAALTAPAAVAFEPSDVSARAPGVAVTERWFVGFHDVPTLREGDTYAGERVVAVDTDLRFIIVETDNPALLQANARLDDDVRYVELDDPLWASVKLIPNDAFWNHAANWAVKKIDAPTAWDVTIGTTAVKVAITDSGILKTHEDLTGSRILQGYDYYNNDNEPDDRCGHGTHVSGTIGATINNGKGFPGMAQVNLAMFKGLEKVFGGCYGSASALVSAMKAAGDGGYPFSSNSWGSTVSNTAFNDAVVYSFDKGVTFIAAAGNDGPCTNCVGYPWRDVADKVIIVGATDENDAQASFSNEGPELDVAAPGVYIGSAYIKVGSCGTNTCYVALDGTSMAAPHVTGTLALVKTLNPSFGYADFDNRIKSTAVDLGTSGFDHEFGHGRINAAAAVF